MIVDSRVASGHGWGCSEQLTCSVLRVPCFVFPAQSNFASIVMFALSKREMGQPALAALAISMALALSAPGIFALTFRCECVTVHPASVLSNVTVAVVWMDSGVRPALPNSAANAIEKQPAWAAAMSSSGFVPAPLSKRVEKEYCVSLSTPLSVEIL